MTTAVAGSGPNPLRRAAAAVALAALFAALLYLAVSALSTAWFGHGFSALGFLPSLLALTLYSMLPILRSAAAGILGVDPAVREAAVIARETDAGYHGLAAYWVSADSDAV